MTDGRVGTRPLSVRILQSLVAVAAAGVLVLLLAKVGIDQVAAGLRSLGLVAPMLATVIAAAGLLISSRELGAVYRFSGAPQVGRLSLVRESAEVVLLNAAIPFAGSARRAAVARERRGVSPSRLITGFLIQIAVATTSASILVAAALISFGTPLMRPAIGGLGAILAVAALLWRRRPEGAGSQGPLVARALLSELVPLFVVRVLMVSMRLWILAAAVGGGGQFVGRLGAAGLAVAAMLVPLLPGGLGLRELLLTSSASWLGLGASGAMVVALMDRVATLLASLLVLVAASAVERWRGVLKHRREVSAQPC